MTFNKGESGNPEGRPKGAVGQFTSLKDSFINAFKELGGQDALINWAKKSERNKAQFFQMITKMLPTNMDANVKAKVILELKKKITDERPEE